MLHKKCCYCCCCCRLRRLLELNTCQKVSRLLRSARVQRQTSLSRPVARPAPLPDRLSQSDDAAASVAAAPPNVAASAVVAVAAAVSA